MARALGPGQQVSGAGKGARGEGILAGRKRAPPLSPFLLPEAPPSDCSPVPLTFLGPRG